MRGYMFRNRMGALFFVLATALGAAVLVGSEEDEGMLLDAADDLRQQKSAMDSAMGDLAAPPVAVPTATVDSFASEEDLIDQATGIDPTPLEEGAPAPAELVPVDEVVIVSRDVAESGQ